MPSASPCLRPRLMRAIVGLLLLLTVAAAATMGFEAARAQGGPETIDLNGRIVLQRTADEGARIGLRVEGSPDVLPDAGPLPVHCAADVWLESSPVVLKGVTLGSLITRQLANGWYEVGFRTLGGEDLLPRARFIRPLANRNWVVSSPITLSIPRPDATPRFLDRIWQVILEPNHPVQMTLPDAQVEWWDLSYSLEPEVPGLTFDPETRILSGSPTEIGSYRMVYRARSSGGGFAELQFSLFVEASQMNEEGDYNGMGGDDSMMEESDDDSMMDESDEAPTTVPSDTTFADNPRTGFTLTSENDTSTFSLDVDLTSYQLALNWAANGFLVEPDSARAEEWINSFDYGYEPPDSDDQFAISTALMEHPIDDELHIARIGFQAPTIMDDRPLNVALVLDASGSMSWGGRVDIARAAAETIHAGLRCIDRIAVVHFTTDVLHQYTVNAAIPGSPVVHGSIGNLAPHDSTNVQRGLDLGVQLVAEMRQQRPDAYNYVILMSDGVANVDATDPFKILALTGDQNAENPIRLITVGVGIQNYNDFLLEQLSQHGNGWYRYLDTPEQARQVFAREHWLRLSTPFADQARTQVVWDEQRVAQWRLIGYENRVTSAESFVEDRTEFAEIPSGVAVTALYELVLTEAGRQSLAAENASFGSVALRWLTPDTGESRSADRSIAPGPDATEDRARAALDQLAAIVGLTADRYGAIDSAHDVRGEQGQAVAPELRALHSSLAALIDRLPPNPALSDFANLLDHLIRSIPDPTTES